MNTEARDPEDSFAYDAPTMKRTDNGSGLDGYMNTLDYASSADLKSSKKQKGTIINRYDQSGKKACCDPCAIF